MTKAALWSLASAIFAILPRNALGLQYSGIQPSFVATGGYAFENRFVTKTTH
jgi:hypothetical protein